MRAGQRRSLPVGWGGAGAEAKPASGMGVAENQNQNQNQNRRLREKELAELGRGSSPLAEGRGSSCQRQPRVPTQGTRESLPGSQGPEVGSCRTPVGGARGKNEEEVRVL